MKKLSVLLISVLFIGALFAFPFNTEKPLNYQEMVQKLKNLEISDPATYIGTIKEVYIELDTGLSKSKIILDTEEGTEMEIYIGPMWRFIELKPGMQVELQAVEVKFNDNISFNLAFELSSNGITIEIPYRKIIRNRLELMKNLAYQRRLHQKLMLRGMPMYGPMYGPMYSPMYGPMYGPMHGPKFETPYDNEQEMPQHPPYTPPMRGK
ncbi:hypothetical protein [Thermosipho atlanticus]|uniref:Uncharacterized protein n=1 Tax=Thermosipho atlanticus DSM 15807 TaxID=1123380 RepID=A0A1M5RRH9_9BACT|nr:hypothetical protein [Thermosipho atlanticus]SHH28875.1 hypothetical protein SAMN02745199_0578 [Thermosipho atlanticus DSM 15807]